MASLDSLAESHSPQERAQVIETDRSIAGAGEYLQKEFLLPAHLATMGSAGQGAATICSQLTPNSPHRTAARGKELVLVAALPQSVDHPGTPRSSMAAILLEREKQLLADELRPRHSTIPRRSSQQPIIGGIEGYRRFLSGHCHPRSGEERRGGMLMVLPSARSEEILRPLIETEVTRWNGFTPMLMRSQAGTERPVFRMSSYMASGARSISPGQVTAP